MFVSPQNPYVEVPTPKSDSISGGALSHEGGALMNGISDLIKEAAESTPLPSSFHHVMRYQL